MQANITDEKFAAERELMVDKQLLGRDIRDARVLAAMQSVPRHEFVPAEYQAHSYADGPLPIGYGQTISQPYIVALMSQLLGLQGEETVLEVGAGSGYQAAVLARLVRQVHTVERIAHLANSAAQTFVRLGYKNIQVHVGDGSLGLAEFSPYDGILVTAAAPEAPPALLEQLGESSRLVIPVGARYGQSLEVWERYGKKYHRQEIIPVAFVPLVGQFGWPE